MGNDDRQNRTSSRSNSRSKWNAAARKFRGNLRDAVVGPGGMRRNLGLDQPPPPPPPSPMYNLAPPPVSASALARGTGMGVPFLPRPLSLADREPTSLMPPTIARNDSTAELMASRRTLRQNPLDLAKVRQSQTPLASSMMKAEADRINAQSANIRGGVDSIAKRMAEGAARATELTRREREAYQNKIANMTPGEFREEVRSTNRGSGNYFDMTEGPYGRRDTVVVEPSAVQAFNSRLAMMSPEELKREAFTSRQSGLKGSGPYGGRATYTQPGGMAGREAALAGSSLGYGAGTGPVEQPPRKSVNTGTVVGYDRAQQIAKSMGGDDGDFKEGDTVNLGDGAVFTVAKNTNDPLRAIKGDSVLLGTQGRFGGPRRDGEVRKGPDGAYATGGDLTTNAKFMAQKERRAQRRTDALATARSMAPYRSRGASMNQIFLDENGRADPLMNAGMPREAVRRDQLNAQRSQSALEFGRRQDLAERQQGFSERRQDNLDAAMIAQQDAVRLENQRANARAEREYEDQSELRSQELRKVELENDRLEAENERIESEADSSLIQNEQRILERQQLDDMNPYIDMPVGTNNEKVEYLNSIYNHPEMSEQAKKRAAERIGITNMNQLNRLISNSGYEGGDWGSDSKEWGFWNFLFGDWNEAPETGKYREETLSGARRLYGG